MDWIGIITSFLFVGYIICNECIRLNHRRVIRYVYARQARALIDLVKQKKGGNQ
jgi:hypothetical protein